MQTNALPDQTDILAENERLHADLKTANDSLAQANANLATVTTERDTWKGRAEKAESGLTALERERDTLKGENTTLKTELADFNKRVAAELAKHGIRPQAAAHQNESDRKLTATEKCLAAKGAAAQ